MAAHGTAGNGTAGNGTAADGEGRPRRPAARPTERGRPRAEPGESGLRGLIGSGRSRVSRDAAMRARDVAHPTDADLAAADRTLVIRRRPGPPPERSPLPAVLGGPGRPGRTERGRPGRGRRETAEAREPAPGREAAGTAETAAKGAARGRARPESGGRPTTG
jgi:hypothetical protein